MVRFFAKKEDKIQLTDAEIAELSKNAYELGYEVGYHKHSELGWVSERYSMLENLAKDAGLDGLVRDQYAKGKEDGLKTKERDMNAGLSKKEAENQQQSHKIEYNVFLPEGKENFIESGFENNDHNDNMAGMIQRPSLMNLPGSTSKIKAIDKPSQLKGFRPLNPKR